MDLDSAINQTLELMGAATTSDRIYIFEDLESETGEHLANQRYEWARETAMHERENPDLQKLAYYPALARWYEALSSGRPINGLVREFPDSERIMLEPHNAISLLAIPSQLKAGIGASLASKIAIPSEFGLEAMCLFFKQLLPL
jgi:hypothetical protein